MSAAAVALILAGAAGVVATKVVPSLLLPEVLPSWADRVLRFLPPSVLGAFTAYGAFPHALGSRQPLLFAAALLLPALVVARTHHVLWALAAGWGALVGLHLAGLY